MATSLFTRRRSAGYTALTAVSALVLTACGSEPSPQAQPTPQAQQSATVAEPVAVTYDGGIYLLDGKTLQVAKDIPLDGFNRLNAAGDDRHLMVSTSTGFRVLDAAGAVLTGTEVTAPKPGHVVRHAGKTVLFADGTGEVTVFDPKTLGTGPLPAPQYKTPEAHHGVAVNSPAANWSPPSATRTSGPASRYWTRTARRSRATTSAPACTGKRPRAGKPW